MCKESLGLTRVDEGEGHMMLLTDIKNATVAPLLLLRINQKDTILSI